MEQYYDDKYFEFQKEQGEFAAEMMFHFFQPYIKPGDAVLDFGCGGGFLLNKINCGQKLGIEINVHARKSASGFNIKTVETPGEVENEWADVLISSHALEHVLRPYDILVELYAKTKKGGKVVFIVPHETKYAFNTEDVNKHLYTWSEMNLGNLFTEAGFSVIESKELLHRFPPKFRKIHKLFGTKLFHKICNLYAHWARYRHMTQIRLIAEKK
jgi:SAM-dependent methyltransferase